MGVSHNLHDHIIIGLSMSSYFLDIAGHGKTSGMGFSFSALYFLNNEIRIAGLLSNFNEPGLKKELRTWFDEGFRHVEELGTDNLKIVSWKLNPKMKHYEGLSSRIALISQGEPQSYRFVISELSYLL